MKKFHEFSPKIPLEEAAKIWKNLRGVESVLALFPSRRRRKRGSELAEQRGKRTKIIIIIIIKHV